MKKQSRANGPVRRAAPITVAGSQLDESIRQDVEIARRRARDNRKQRRSKVSWINITLITATVTVSIPMLGAMKTRLNEYGVFHNEVVRRQTLALSLEKQVDSAKQRLAMLDHDKGRVQMLVERGYIKPGQRILLFPNADGASPAAQQVLAASPLPAEVPSRETKITLDSIWRTVRGLSPEDPTQTSLPGSR